MRRSVRLGRIAHIEVGFHWSVLVIIGLLAWSLAEATLPDLAPGSSTFVYWVVAATGAVLLFASLLAHELAHSVVAERRGVRVEGITLWLLGGVSQLHGEAATPQDEFEIASAGPLTSVLLALGFGGVALLTAMVGGPDLLVAIVGWLAVVNLVLAIFNVLPAAPLDGGRLLHAAVWRRTGDRSRATMVATRAGGWLGYTLVGLGILLTLVGDLSGLWFVLLGWFLLAASRAEATHELLHGALVGVRVRDVMTAEPIVAPADTTLAVLVDEWFLRHDCSAYPLRGAGGDIVGLVTLSRVKAVPRHDWGRVTAGEIAEPLGSLATATPDESLPSLLDRISTATTGGGRALVFEGATLVGIVTPTDVQRAVDLAALREPRPRGRADLGARTTASGGVA
jgi:Zn-dependent protease